MAYKKGYSFERSLKLKLESEGWHVIRSGGSKKPDLVCGRNGKIMIIECKVTGSDKIYLEKAEVDKMQKVAEAFGGECMYAIKRLNAGVSLVSIDQLKDTGNTYSFDLRI